MARTPADRRAQREARLERAKARRARLSGTRRPAAEADGSQVRRSPVLWRNRDRLAPLYVGGAAWAAGAAGYAHHVPPLAVAAVTAAAGAGTWYGAPKWTKLRAVEVKYACTAVSVTGVWITMADAAGAQNVVYPWLAALLGVGTPWWRHRRVRRKVQVERTINAWDSIAEMAGVAGMKVPAASVLATAHGWHGRYTVEPPMTARGAKEFEAQLAAAIAKKTGKRLPEDAVTLEPTDVGGGNIHVLESDPHADPQPWTAPTDAPSITDPIDLGPYADGAVALLSLWVSGDGMAQLLISGVKGSGKTGLLLLLAMYLIECADTQTIYLDLKGGQDTRLIADGFDRWENTVPGAMDALAWLKAEVDRRGQAATERIWTPTADQPAIVCFIDELAELPEDAHEDIASIARRGRSLGVQLITATQYPTNEVVPSQARAQLDTRFTFRLAEQRHRTVSMRNAGERNPMLFPDDRPGTCFFEGRGARDLSLRVRFVTDAHLAEAALRYAGGALTQVDTKPSETEPPVTARGGDQPPRDPDKLPAIERVPMERLKVERPDLDEQPALSDADAEALLDEALARAAGTEGVSPKELMALTGRKNSWTHEQLDSRIKAGTARRLGRGRYAAMRQLTTTGGVT